MKMTWFSKTYLIYHLRTMKAVIVTLCSTDIRDSTNTFNVKTVDWVCIDIYWRSSYTSGGTSAKLLTCPSKSIDTYTAVGADSGSTQPQAQNPDAESRSPRGNVIWLRYMEPTHLHLQFTAPHPPRSLDPWPDSEIMIIRSTRDFLPQHPREDAEQKH